MNIDFYRWKYGTYDMCSNTENGIPKIEFRLTGAENGTPNPKNSTFFSARGTVFPPHLLTTYTANLWGEL